MRRAVEIIIALILLVAVNGCGGGKSGSMSCPAVEAISETLSAASCEITGSEGTPDDYTVWNCPELASSESSATEQFRCRVLFCGNAGPGRTERPYVSAFVSGRPYVVRVSALHDIVTLRKLRI